MKTLSRFDLATRRTLAAATACVALASCALPDPQRASVVAQPTTPVVKNFTNFTNSLRCMDDLFLANKKKDVVITSDGLPDQTGQITTGTKEMMISAISRMSAKSGAFRFVDIDRKQDAVFWIQQNWIGVREGLVAPNYYIRGAITQVDAGVMVNNQSVGVSIPQFSLGVSRDQLVSVVSMDMNIGDLISRQIMAGLSSTNSVAVVKTGKGLDTEGLIQKAGIFLRVSADQSQGSHQAVRSLVELGVIEVLGKLTQVPYWKCLEIDSTSPDMMAQARDWFEGIPPNDKVFLAQNALNRAGFYSVPPDSVMTAVLRDAITKYKVKHDLIPDGRIDFDLYYSFLINNLAVRAEEKHLEASVKPIPASLGNASSSSPPGAVDLRLDVIGNSSRIFNVGDTLRFAISVDRDAFVYCYYRDETGSVARVFPNRFQQDPKVTPSASVQVPAKSAGFSIALERPATEAQLSCVATDKSYGAAKPFVLDEGDLKPLSAADMQVAIDQHLDADRFTTTVRQMNIKVR
jgi:hypothetical protein